MPSTIYSLNIDYRLNTFPTEEELRLKLINPLEKLAGTEFLGNAIKHKKSLSLILHSKDENKNYMIVIRVYNQDIPEDKILMTILFESPKKLEDVFGLTSREDLEEYLKDKFEDVFGTSSESSNFFPVLRRGLKDSPYLRTSDDRLIEYGFKEVCFSQRSEYQLVQIANTNDFGRFLILDGLVNYAESDRVDYTHNLMCLNSGFESKYKDANVLILGGGDGALMNELLCLKNPPKMVTMIEIDEVVMDAVNEHMPDVCGPYLRRDNRKGPRHNIIVGDAVAFIKEQIEKGSEYDFVFGDLTDMPVSTGSRSNELWGFLKMIIEMGVKLLKPDTGYYMTHCIGINATEAIEEYEKVLKQIYNAKCTFNQTDRKSVV